MYTIGELSKIASIGRTSLYKAISERRLVARKIGRRTLILAEDFQKFTQALPTLGDDELTHDREG